MPRLKGKKVLKIQGGGELPFARPSVEERCSPGEHTERIYFPEVDPSEAHPLKRLEKLKQAGNDAFEIAAVEHNIHAGHITHGRQISRGATPEELVAGLSGDHQHIRAVCIKCGASREIDHASGSRAVTECKNQEGKYGSPQMKNNKALVERSFKVSYKVPDSKRHDRKLDGLREAGFEVILVKLA